MSYELSIPLKRATLELEFDTVAGLERQLAKLDLPRIERAVAAALRGDAAAAKTRSGKAAKAAGRKGAAKGAAKRATKKPATRGRAK